MFFFKPSALLIVFALVLVPASITEGQRPGGGGPPGAGGPGGPNATVLKLVDKFDKDGDGVLNAEERALARKAAQKGGGDRRGGPGGPGGRNRRGGAQLTGKPGPQVNPSEVKTYPEASLYEPTALRTVFLEFEADDWEKELAEFKPTDVEVPATLTVDGKTYPNVGVSFRGSSSFFHVAEGMKRSLNLSMDFIEPKQRLYGYKTLNLLNCNGDSSFMSSILYSQIASQRIATPKANFVNVVINGRSWGVYSNVQQFNKDFLDENFDTKKGNRWKVLGSPRGDGGLRYLGEDVELYKSRFQIKSADNEQAWRDLIHLCKVLNETPADQLESALAPILDIDGALWFLAVDVALVNSDGYWVRASDYSIYQDPQGKFHILPHDMNECFRASRGGPGGPGGRPVAPAAVDEVDSVLISAHRLVKAPQTVLRHHKVVAVHLKNVAQDHPNDLEAIAQKAAALVAEEDREGPVEGESILIRSLGWITNECHCAANCFPFQNFKHDICNICERLLPISSIGKLLDRTSKICEI